MNNAGQVSHHFTVDVEEYFQVASLAPHVARSSWDATPTRLEVGMRPIIELLAEHNAKGTFFILGWIAKRHPELVREIARAGHEVASHGWGHEKVTTLTPDQFRESVRDSKVILEDLTGLPVFGYRAPSFSIIRGGEWALDILIEESYRYDSSLFPVKRSGYGFAGGQRDRHRLERPAGVLDELPPATVKVGSEAPAGRRRRLFPPPTLFIGTGGAPFRVAPRGTGDILHSSVGARSATTAPRCAASYADPSLRRDWRGRFLVFENSFATSSFKPSPKHSISRARRA